MAMEFMKQPIRINAVCPGGTDTAMNKTIHFPDDIDWELINRYSSARGMAPAEDLASAIAYIASDEAKRFTDQYFQWITALWPVSDTINF